MKTFLTTIAMVVALQFTAATAHSEVLLTIDSTQVTADEFMRIYNKNSSITLEEKKSVEEYLDLFINYKLKVVEAMNLGYDTVSTFVKEMEGYTEQLAKPYLDNSEILDEFVEASYERYKEEIHASHILLRVQEGASPMDTLKNYNLIANYKKQYDEGKSFEDIIKENSPNPSQEIGGDLGWFSTMRMVYPFEIAAYNTAVGEVSEPVRTQFGYHLIKINDRRANRGEVKVRHIMAMFPRQNPSDLDKAAAKRKIESAYKELEADSAWNDVVIKYTEHRATAQKGGTLGWMRSGMAPDKFIDLCFEMEDSVYSEPFETEYGWHIVMVDEKKGISSYEEYKEANEKRIKQSVEVKKLSAQQRLANIKEEYGSTTNMEAIKEVVTAADTSWMAANWDEAEALGLTKEVFTIGNKSFDQAYIAKFLIESKLIDEKIEESQLIKRVNEYLAYEVLKYEREQLPIKHPEYRLLLDEYHDGILLFNLTEDMVWHKAVEDTAGLETFYNTLEDKYQWGQRVEIAKYSYPDSAMVKDLVKVAKKRGKKGLSLEEISALVCGQDTLICIAMDVNRYEKGENAVADSIAWKPNTYMVSKDDSNWVLYYVEGILPAKTKELNEAKGLYTADYQSYLEQLWIAELRNKYTIEVNEEVLSSLEEESAE